jgi:hypothetical protein
MSADESTLLKRLAEIDVSAAAPAAAAATYQHNFGFARRSTADAERIVVGDAELRILPAAGREGLAALWLECNDLDRVIAALTEAGIAPPPARVESGMRMIELDPHHTAGARVVVFDRRV